MSKRQLSPGVMLTTVDSGIMCLGLLVAQEAARGFRFGDPCEVAVRKTAEWQRVSRSGP